MGVCCGMYISIHIWRGKSTHKLNSWVFWGAGCLEHEVAKGAERGMQAGELPGQGNDGGREAVEGREDQVGRGMRGDGCIADGRAQRESGDGFVRCDGTRRLGQSGVRSGWRVGRCGPPVQVAHEVVADLICPPVGGMIRDWGCLIRARFSRVLGTLISETGIWDSPGRSCYRRPKRNAMHRQWKV